MSWFTPLLPAQAKRTRLELAAWTSCCRLGARLLELSLQLPRSAYGGSQESGPDTAVAQHVGLPRGVSAALCAKCMALLTK